MTTRRLGSLTMLTALCVLAVLLFTPLRAMQATPAAQGAGATSSDWAGLRWRNIGPFVGGRVTAIAGHRKQTTTYYMGSTGGGLFKTTDNGATWLPIADGQFETGSIGAIEVAESDPNIVYVGTGSVAIRSNVIEGRGMYKSTDAGRTWTHIGLRDAGQIGSIRVHPADPNLLYVAVLGSAFGPSDTRGVYRSKDGGATWQRVKFISRETGFVNLAMNPANPNEIYAAAWRGERKPWTIISGGPAVTGGLYKTTDGGETWTRLGGGLPPGIIGKIDVDIARSQPTTVYALVEAPRPLGGLYRSDDSGATWKQQSDQAANLLQRPFYYTYVDVDPKNPDVVWVSNVSMYKSTDAGRTWRTWSTPHGDNHGMWINPDNPNLLIQSNDGGANVSTDGGTTWSTQRNQSTAEIYGVEVDNQFPYRVYGAQQDNDTWIVLSKMPTSQRLDVANTFQSGPGCETGPIKPRPDNPNIVYGVCKGEFYRGNMITGQTQSNWVYPQNRYGHASRDITYRFQRTSPFMISKHNPDMILHGSHVVHRTMDGGKNWEIISGDLTLNEPGPQQDISGEPITRDITGEEVYSTIFAIEESPIEAGVIWVGANDGPVHVSRDNGKTWQKVTPNMPAGGRVQNIEPSPHRKGSAYVVTTRQYFADMKPYVHVTNDYGKTWTLLTPGTNGIPADSWIRVVREDPDREGLLYAGGQFGFFLSFDNGKNWQRFQQNLPVTPVTDIRVHQQDLVISTMGRGFWILDNVTPLHQARPADAGGQLFAPRAAYRSRHASMPVSPTTPELPGPGAIIDYAFKTAPSEGATLEIRSASGELMRTVRSTPGGAAAGDGLPVAQPSGMTAPPLPGQAAAAGAGRAGGGRGGRGGGAPAAPFTARAGMQRYVWDMQSDAGLTVPPGRYTVKLTAGSWSESKPLEIKLDPRLVADGVTTEDLEVQYRFNIRLRATIAEAQQFTTAVRTAHGAAAEPQKKALQAILDELVDQQGIQYPQPMLNAQLNAVTRVSNVADARPNNDAVRRLDDLTKQLADLKAKAAALGVK